MSIKNKNIFKTGLSFVLITTILTSSFILGGCSNKKNDTSGNGISENKQTDSKNKMVDFGKLGFVTEFIQVPDTRVIGDAESIAYILRNEENQVYVLMGFYDKSYYNLIGGTFEIVKLTDGFKASRIYQCIDYKDNKIHGDVSENNVYFYIKDNLNNYYKCTLHRGKYVNGKVDEKNSVSCEKIDIPGEVVDFQISEYNGGNFAINDKGEVYAWNNTLKENEYSDSVEDRIIGFADGKRHDTPTKLPINDITEMCSLGESSERIYLTKSGEVYVKEIGKDFKKLENISEINHIYSVDSTDKHEFIGINNKSQIELYKIGLVKTEKEQTALSSVSAQSTVFSSNYCYYHKEADGVNNIRCDTKYYAFCTNSSTHGTEYYEYNHGIKLCEYYNITDNTTTPINVSADYIGKYGDTWLDKSGNLYWYNSLNKNEDYILASGVKEYVICNKNAYLLPKYVEAQFDGKILQDNIKFIYHNDGSVKMFTCNVSEGYTKIIDLNPSYYGNGTFGTLIPGDNGKYLICNKMKEDGSYDIVQEIELPE